MFFMGDRESMPFNFWFHDVVLATPPPQQKLFVETHLIVRKRTPAQFEETNRAQTVQGASILCLSHARRAARIAERGSLSMVLA